MIVQLQDAPAQTSAFWHVAKSLCFANTTLKGFFFLLLAFDNPVE